MSVIEQDAVSRAALEMSRALGEEIGAEAVVVIIIKREGENVISKSRLSMSSTTTLTVGDVQEALLYAVEDVAEEERPLS